MTGAEVWRAADIYWQYIASGDMRSCFNIAAMPNYIARFAINADDVPRARDFYQRVFGWEFEPWGPPNFYLIETGGEQVRASRRSAAGTPRTGTRRQNDRV